MPLAKQLLILAMVVAVVAALMVCAGYAGASSTPTAFYPDADARVDSANPNANLGTLVSLRTGSTQETYLRFTTYDLVGPTERAVLRLWVTNGSADGPAVYATSNDWTETSITWNNRPARTSGATDDKGKVTANQWIEWDITPLVPSTGTYAFVVVQPGSDPTHFQSREGDASKRPMLIVSTAGNTVTATPTVGPTATPTASPIPTPTTTLSATPPSSSTSLIGAGDIADGGPGAAQTELLLNANPDALVVALGDYTYNGIDLTDPEYADTWGRHKDRTLPVLGNHDMSGSPPASEYFNYFGDAAGPVGSDRGYYAVNVGTWRIYILNSNCDRHAELCSPTGAQLTWLREDLAANPRQCSMAITHHPFYTSGVSNMNPALQKIWIELYAANVDIVWSAHSHRYERYHPQDAYGQADNLRGVREFVVGTGGAFFQGAGSAQPNVAVRQNNTWGVVRFDLKPGEFDYRFIPVAGKTFSDSGTGIGCH